MNSYVGNDIGFLAIIYFININTLSPSTLLLMLRKTEKYYLGLLHHVFLCVISRLRSQLAVDHIDCDTLGRNRQQVERNNCQQSGDNSQLKFILKR